MCATFLNLAIWEGTLVSFVERRPLVHILKARIWGNNIVERKLVVFALSHLLGGEGPPGHLPDDKAKGIHVCRLERLKTGLVQCLIQHLWSHVAPCSYPGVGGDVDFVCFTVKPDCETKV